jgi:hypothetical protein
MLRAVKEEIALRRIGAFTPKGVTVFWPLARQHFALRALVIDPTSIEDSAMEIWVEAHVSRADSSAVVPGTDGRVSASPCVGLGNKNVAVIPQSILATRAVRKELRPGCEMLSRKWPENHHTL